MSTIHDALSKTKQHTEHFSPASNPGALPSDFQRMMRGGLTLFILVLVALLGVWGLGHVWEGTSSKRLALRQASAPATERPRPIQATLPLPQFVERHTINPAAFALTGIVSDQQARLAIVNGTVVGVGDRVGGAQVVEIDDHEVTLSHRDREIRLKLR